jgi:hypothetical protein
VTRKFSVLRIAIDHIGRPSLMEGIHSAELSELACYPNVVVKISGLITDAPTAWSAGQFAPWVQGALSAFGAERVMYGSDWPSYLPVGTWKESLAAFTQALGAQTMETREHLLGATARRFYRLRPPDSLEKLRTSAASSPSSLNACPTLRLFHTGLHAPDGSIEAAYIGLGRHIAAFWDLGFRCGTAHLYPDTYPPSHLICALVIAGGSESDCTTL